MNSVNMSSNGFTIPSTQTAAIVPAAGVALEIRKNHPVKQAKDLNPGECLVKMTHTGVCHTDLHAWKGDWPIAPMTPLIGGHEGIGQIVAIGDSTVAPPSRWETGSGSSGWPTAVLTASSAARATR